MTKTEIAELMALAAKWNVGEAMPYSSHPDFDDGIDRGRENCADELEYWVEQKLKAKAAGPDTLHEWKDQHNKGNC